MKIDKSDFEIKPQSYGRYMVTYTSPKTKKSWSVSLTNVELIEIIRTNPSARLLNYIKWLCKNVGNKR
jgi:hypothetical protein